MYQIIIFFLGIAISLFTMGCNTMEGLGKDVKRGGEKLEKAAEKHT
ncbi:MAG: entericidin A/B family lipoprotein [Pseudomonadota bacterium]|jgi:entericidin B|nr:entericidin A/B family lipoprotein [Alphaproteobacteria bacterium]